MFPVRLSDFEAGDPELAADAREIEHVRELDARRAARRGIDDRDASIDSDYSLRGRERQGPSSHRGRIARYNR